jgi:hypothetical protein
MALNVEDGTIVANANSYATLVFIKSYAADRGVVISDDDPAVTTSFAIKATDYIETFARQFVGTQKTVGQSLSWPRSNVTYSDGTPFPDNVIPITLQQAEAQLVIEQMQGIDLMPSVNTPMVIREKIDVLETQYSEKIGVSLQPWMPRVEALLSKLFYNSSGLAMRSVRV